MNSSDPGDESAPLPRACAAEAAGTFLLVFFGVGAVQASVLTYAHAGLWQVASVWGAGVSLAIYATSRASGAHLNPAITLSFAMWRGFNKSRAAAYAAAQLAGAFAAAAVLYMIFRGVMTDFETQQTIQRGSEASVASAMCFGEYFPNPAFGWTPQRLDAVGEFTACAAEFAGTLILTFVVFSLPSNGTAAAFAPLLVGLAVAAIISVIGPLTQAGLNPARDFGPRLFAFFAGWGDVAIPGPRGGFFTVYILSPLLGGVAGAGLYRLIFSRRATGG